MAQPRVYSPSTNFTDHSTVAPSDPHSGANLDVEFVELKQNTDDLNTNIALLQRDDGKLLNASVHKDAFDQDALALIGASGSGFTPRGDWVTATAYVSGDLVTNNAATYLTVTASHTSGTTFAGDLASHWQLIANSAIETTSASVDTHNGTGSQTLFTTTYTYSAPKDIQVFVNGSLQIPTAYTVTNASGNNITFTTAPPIGTGNVIIWGATVVAEAAKAGALIYRDEAGASATSSATSATTATTQAGVATTQANSATTNGATATAQAGIATTQAGTATTQAGIATTQAGTATTQAGTSTTQAATSTTQAGIATTQAGIATTQAGLATTNGAAQVTLATTQVGLATTQATNAATSATNAATSATSTAADLVLTNADVALTNADVVTTTASELAAKASAAAVASTFDAFDDTYLGTMSDTSAQGTNPTTNGTWAKDSSAITVVSGTNIKVGQVVTGTGMPSPPPNVISVSGTAVVVSENMAALGSAVALTFTGYGVYGTYNGTKDGPTTDNDNGALANGMLYFNSTDNNMMVYKETGASWIAATSSGGVSLVMHKAVASGSETSFAATDFTPTLSYEVNNIVVFLNGVRLDATDYTATTGTTITGLSALSASDEMTILAFKTFEVADAVSAASGGTFSGAVTASAGVIGNLTGNASTATTAGTVTTAAQPAITSVGTLTGFTSTGIDDNATSTAITIDASEHVGIGVTVPEGILHVRLSDASVTPEADADDLVIEGNGATGITIGSATDSVGSVRFADSGGGHQGMIYYNHAGDHMRFYTGATERMRIDADGAKFNGDTAAANALDDYEEGTYTCTGNNGGSGANCYYTKIGRLVTVQIKFTAGSTSDTTLSLPFAGSSTNRQWAPNHKHDDEHTYVSNGNAYINWSTSGFANSTVYFNFSYTASG